MREENTDEETPADIRYVALHGTYAEKCRLTTSTWTVQSSSRCAPVGAISLLLKQTVTGIVILNCLISMPVASRVKPNRTWVYAPSEVLQERWAELIEGNDLQVRAERFKETRDAKTTEAATSRYRYIPREVVKALTTRLRRLIPDTPNIVQVGYRSLTGSTFWLMHVLPIRPAPSYGNIVFPGRFYCGAARSLSQGRSGSVFWRPHP